MNSTRILNETIPAAVTASIAARPDADAVAEPGRRLTYRELGELVSTSTRAMLAAGVEPGDRVAIWAPNGSGWIVAALGAQAAGAALVPINTRWKGAEAAYVLSASKAVLLFTTVGFLDIDTVAMLRAAETRLPFLRRIVLLDGSASAERGPDGAEVEHWHTFATRAEEITAGAASERRLSVRPTDTSDILFTSGTTGRPKGVLMTHGQTVQQFREWCDVRRTPARGPLSDRQPVLPHVRIQGGLAGVPAARRHDRPGPRVRRSPGAVAGADGAHHGIARRSHRLPVDPRLPRSRLRSTCTPCASRSPARPMSPSS